MLAKAFRLFVSSTFNDFVEERDLLQSKVFPRLDAYCGAKGYQFQAVDLRWGVNEEAQLDQRTAEICLAEVNAAKSYPPPNFLIMVGDRYGWVPLPSAIPQDEFEAATAWLMDRGREEAARGLRKVYWLDENHVVPPGLKAAAGSGELMGSYTLRSREDDIPELAPAEVWQKLEDRLRDALQEAADHLLQEGHIGETAYARYFLSLTEQEIIQGLPGYNLGAGNGAQPASAQPYNGLQSIAWIRVHAGAGPNLERSPSLLRRMLGWDPRPPGLATSAVERVKSAILRALPADCVLSGRATRNGDGQLDAAYLKDFAARIESRLRAAIDKHIAERSEEDELLQERAQHQAFALGRRSVFYGRDGNRSAIESYLAGDDPHPLVLFGPSGLGKSALMARAVADAEESGPGVPVVYRFVGASAASTDVRSLLVSVVEDLAAHGIVPKPAQWEDDANKFEEQISTLLLSIDTPAAIFIDALDQLKKPRRLGWLPYELPPRLKIVVSVLNDAAYEEDSGVYRALRQRLPSQAFLEIEPLTASQGRDILVALEERAQRRLRLGQRDYVLTRFETASASPLYLRVAFEIARAWRSWDGAGQGRRVLAGHTSALVGQLIAELSSVHHHEPELVSRTLGYLAAAKDGLSVKEVTEILSGDRDVMTAISSERHGARTHKLPASVWVRLNRQLASLLVEKRVDDQPLLQFFHRQVAQVAREQHYEGPAKPKLHGALADYFDSRGVKRKGGADYDKRTLSELPFQLNRSENTARLGEILLSPDWMQQKLAAAGLRALIDDYQYARTKAQKLTGQTLELVAGVLARDERQLAPQILGRMGAALLDEPSEVAAIGGLLHKARALVVPPALVPRWANFTAPGGPEIRRFEAHTLWVTAVAFSPDGRHIVSGSWDFTLRLWETASGQSRLLKGHDGYVTAVAFSPDGQHIVSSSHDKTLRLWEMASGQSRPLEGHTGCVTAVAFSPDGKHIVSGSDDKMVRLWDVASGKSYLLKGHASGVTAVTFSPDGQHIVSGSHDKTLRLWEVASGQSRALEGHIGGVTVVAFSPDGKHIVSGSHDKTLRLWDVASGQSRPLEGHTDSVWVVALSPDGQHIVSGSRDMTLRLWEVASGQSRSLQGHTGGVTAVAFSPDGQHIASGSEDRTPRLWEVASGQSCPLEGHTRSVLAVAFSPDGQHIASGSEDRTLRLWEVASGHSRATERHTDSVLAVAFSPDGRHIASGSHDKTLRLWDVASGQSRALEGHTTSVTAVAFSPDGRHIVSGSDDLTLRLWDAASGLSCPLEGQAGRVMAVAFSPDGRHIASGSRDKTLRLWEVASGLSRPLEGHTRSVTGVAFSPDGKHIVSGSHDMTLRLWEVASGQSRTLEGHTGRVLAVAFSPDGKYIVSGSDDHTLRLWEVASGQSRILKGHLYWVCAVAFSPDGRYIVSGSDDLTLRLWDAASGRELARFEGDGPFRAVDLNGKSIATGAATGGVHVFDTLTDDADRAAWLLADTAGHRSQEVKAELAGSQ